MSVTRDEIVLEFLRAYFTSQELRHTLASGYIAEKSAHPIAMKNELGAYIVRQIFEFADLVLAEQLRRDQP